MIVAISVAALTIYLTAAVAAVVAALTKSPTVRMKAWMTAAAIAAGTAITWTITGLIASDTGSLIAGGVWAFITFLACVNYRNSRNKVASGVTR